MKKFLNKKEREYYFVKYLNKKNKYINIYDIKRFYIKCKYDKCTLKCNI